MTIHWCYDTRQQELWSLDNPNKTKRWLLICKAYFWSFAEDNMEQNNDEQWREDEAETKVLGLEQEQARDTDPIATDEKESHFTDVRIECNDTTPSSFSSSEACSTASKSTLSSSLKSLASKSTNSKGQSKLKGQSTIASKVSSNTRKNSVKDFSVDEVIEMDEGEENEQEQQGKRERNCAFITFDDDGDSLNTIQTDSYGNQLFQMKGSSKKHWYFVRLVARKGSDMSKITSNDAIKAFCLLCRKDIYYSKGNGNSVYRHIEKDHKKKLTELEECMVQPAKKKLKPSNLTHFFSTARKQEDMKFLPQDDQLHGESLLVQWIAQSLRPFVIVEDQAFIEYSRFLCLARGQFKVPSRTKIRKQMMDLGDYVMKTVKTNCQREMDYYSLTTDIWSSRMMQSFMALTLHYVTENFELKTSVIEVQPLVGSHTGK